MDFLTNATLMAAAAVVLVQQILKLKIVPVTFANRYPVPTNIILSIIAAIVVAPTDWAWDNLGHIAVHVGSIAVIAAVTYNQLLGRWAELKAIEG